MKNNEYLNEEKYQKTKSKIIVLSIVIFLIGLIIGGSLIAVGLKNQSDVKSGSSPEAKERLKAKKDNEKQEVQKQKDEINKELATLKAKQSQEFRANGLSEEYYKISSEIESKQGKLAELDSQIWKIEQNYDSDDNSSQFQRYIPFYIFGGFIIFMFGMISLSVYVIAKRREIMAFTAQQVMPVAKEGIEEIAPTLGNAASSIAKGIKEGINEADKEK